MSRAARRRKARARTAQQAPNQLRAVQSHEFLLNVHTSLCRTLVPTGNQDTRTLLLYNIRSSSFNTASAKRRKQVLVFYGHWFVDVARLFFHTNTDSPGPQRLALAVAYANLDANGFVFCRHAASLMPLFVPGASLTRFSTLS